MTVLKKVLNFGIGNCPLLSGSYLTKPNFRYASYLESTPFIKSCVIVYIRYSVFSYLSERSDFKY